MAKLSLTEAELNQYTHQLDSILAYMEQLDQLDIAHEEGTSQVLSLTCPLREDEGVSSLPNPDAILSQAPEQDQRFFLVPKIIDG